MVDRTLHLNFRNRVSYCQHFNMPSSPSEFNSSFQTRSVCFVMILITLQHSFVFLFVKHRIIRFVEGLCWHFTFTFLCLRQRDHYLINIGLNFILVVYIVFKCLRIWEIFSAFDLLIAQLGLIVIIFHVAVFIHLF